MEETRALIKYFMDELQNIKDINFVWNDFLTQKLLEEIIEKTIDFRIISMFLRYFSGKIDNQLHDASDRNFQLSKEAN